MAWKLTRWRLISGLIVTVFFALTGLFVVGRADSRQRDLAQAEVLTPEQLSQLQVGEHYVIEADIDASSRPVIKNLVMACEEHLSTNKKQATGWRTVRVYANTIQLRLGSQTLIPLALTERCPLGRLEYHYAPNTSNQRWKGYVAGQNLTALAEVTSTIPPRFKALDHRRGSRAEFIKSLAGQHLEDSLFFGVFVIIGLLLAFWPAGTDAVKKPKKTL